MRKLFFRYALLFVFVLGGIAPSFSLPMDQSQFVYGDYSKKVSMDFQGARLVDVLKAFSKQTNMNFVAVEDISQMRVTLYFKDVPIEEALNKILTANDLIYEFDSASGIFMVKKVPVVEERIITRIYHLKHATVDTSKLKNTIKIGEGSSDDEGGSSSGSGSSEDSSSGIVAALSGILSDSGSVVEDPRTNSLIIRDLESNFFNIEETLARLDVPVPQILIEVEMLDVSKGTADKIGAKFGETPLSFSGASRNTLIPFDQDDVIDREGFDLTSFREDEFSVGTISASGFSILIQFLRTQSDTRNLARPRILTMNNETAEIKISTNEAVGVQAQTEQSEGLASETIEAERVETGVFLTVTPQANIHTGEIIMAISPRVVEAKQSLEFAEFKDPEERGSNSILKMKTGETIVLGGLLRNETSKTITKVPFLGDIPLLGRFFRHDDISESERELIIFITPKILDADKVTNEINQIEASLQSSAYKNVSRDNVIERELDMMMFEHN